MILDNINLVQKYFNDRCDEIESLATRGDVWVFLCDLVMIDYLANMSNGERPRSLSENYINFINEYFDDKYQNFAFSDGQKDLPEQIFFLRCEIVHQFSLKPGQRELSNGARPRSIVLGHEKNSCVHLDKYTKNGCNSVIFTAEQFTEDVRSAIVDLFKKAENNQDLSDKIMKYTREHPPISTQWE